VLLHFDRADFGQGYTATKYLDVTVHAVCRVASMIILLALEFWKANALISEKVFICSVKVKLCIRQGKAVNLFQELKYGLVLRWRIFQHFACFVIVRYFITEHFVVDEPTTGKSFSKHHSLVGVGVYPEFIRFIHGISPHFEIIL